MLYSKNRIGPDIPLTNLLLYFDFLKKRLIYSKLGAVGKNVDIRPYVTLVHMQKIFLGDNIILRPGTEIHANQNAEVVIEDNVLMGPHAFVTVNSHDYFDRLTPIAFQKEPSAPVNICSGAWICAYSIVLHGVTVGKNSIVAANSVVTRDVEPYTVVGGIPAKFIKKVDDSHEESSGF